VIYGIGEAYDGNIRKRDLLADTPYNTYTRAGLPPTPIAMPGRSALQAAAHPAPGDALYFVAIGDGSGATCFRQPRRTTRRWLLSAQPSCGGAGTVSAGIVSHPRFISLEGGDGAGKSSALAVIRQTLAATATTCCPRASRAARRWPSASARCCWPATRTPNR
jgi:hypothetical protein